MLPTVHIRREAFLVLAWSAIETFRAECFGFLLGYLPTKDDYFYSITSAVPFQKVWRRNIGVDLSEKTDKKFKKFISDISTARLKYLGDFHSHAEYRDYLPSDEMSETDFKEFSKTPEPLEFIIGISSRKKGQAVWEMLPDGSVKGSFGKYNFHFNVYTLINEDDKVLPKKLRIVTPHAIETLNRIWDKK